jgi:hypothetical protein
MTPAELGVVPSFRRCIRHLTGGTLSQHNRLGTAWAGIERDLTTGPSFALWLCAPRYATRLKIASRLKTQVFAEIVCKANQGANTRHAGLRGQSRVDRRYTEEVVAEKLPFSGRPQMSEK